MTQVSHRAAGRLPAYALYGEAAVGPPGDRLHVETISARSRLHDWEIHPHRHEGMFQILYMGKGRAESSLDQARHALLGPAVVTVPAMAAHGFRFEPDVQGHVITVQEPHLKALLAAQSTLQLRFENPALGLLERHGDSAQRLAAVVQALAEEYAQHRPWRDAALDALLVQIMLTVARALPARPAGESGQGAGRATEHVARYRALVDARFRQQPRVVDLAAELGITATQLNRVCRALLGRSALVLLHDRLLLEAQRQLMYTPQSIKRVALDLGFTDAGYFTRFFQRACGQTPSAWRAAHSSSVQGMPIKDL